MKLGNCIKQLQKLEKKYGSDIEVGIPFRFNDEPHRIYKLFTKDIVINYVEKGVWNNEKAIIHISIKDDNC